MAGQAAQIQNAMNANKLFQARQAAGQAFQSSINPDGTYNQNALLQNLRTAGPVAAPEALSFANAGQAGAAANYDMSMKQLTYAANGAAQILADNGGLAPRDAVKGFYDRAAADGHITQAQRDQAEAAFTDDPAQNASIIRQRLTQNLSSQEAMMATTPGSGTLDTGQYISGVQVAPRMAPGGGGAITPVGPQTQNNLPTPANIITPQKVFDPATNSYVLKPTGVIAQEQGMGAFLGPAGQNVPNPRQGRYPTTAMQASPALGQEPAANIAGTENAKQGVSLAQTADQVPTRKAALDNMLSDLQTLNTGPGADWEKTANALSSRLTGLGITMSPDQIAKQESFAKLSKQIALAQTSALGAGTDEKLTTALGANPNTDLSKLGNTQIVGMLKGNEDAIALKNLSWQQYQAAHGPQSYGQFSTQFNHTFDPRALQAVYMDPADKAKLSASLSKDPLAKARFITTLKQGMAAGIIQAPTNGQ